MGAAVLARISCHSGKFRLQSLRDLSLYLAKGLLEISQGESVLWFRITIIQQGLEIRAPQGGIFFFKLLIERLP